MIGVVVWSSAVKEKAVIWCEDHASLAYLQGRTNLDGVADWPAPGDLLELDCEMIGQLRHARRVSILSERCCPQLSEALRHPAPQKAAEPRLRLVSDTSEEREVATCDTPPLRFASAR